MNMGRLLQSDLRRPLFALKARKARSENENRNHCCHCHRHEQFGNRHCKDQRRSAFEVIDRIYRNKKGQAGTLWDAKSHTAHYGYIYDGDERIDEVLVLIMRGPNSYTAEDTVEIDCHGGIRMVQRILETVLHNGARTAQPGEFTKRAFLNGRLDLAQAEAVAELIHASNDYALKSSVSQLGGSVSGKIRALRETILYETALLSRLWMIRSTFHWRGTGTGF